MEAVGSYNMAGLLENGAPSGSRSCSAVLVQSDIYFTPPVANIIIAIGNLAWLGGSERPQLDVKYQDGGT